MELNNASLQKARRGRRPSRAVELSAEGLAAVERSEDRMWHAELHRLRGEVLAKREAPASEVEACFRQAIEVARRQDSKSLELRATTSLSRLLQSQRRGNEARRILGEVHGWFTEGLDTRDWQQAHELIASLRAVGED